MSNAIQITLIGKPGCHLCDDAWTVLSVVVSEFAAAHPSVRLEVDERNMLDDQDLIARYSEEIPVVLLNGKMHSYWRIDAKRLTAKLEELI